MTRVYDTVEPAVVDSTMLQNAVFSQGPQGVAGMYAKKEGVRFDTVECLRLDYQNILKIDNLWAFKNLVKLQLDNNIIEKIEGLDHLVNLRWLDLSFNNIEQIEGLDTLVQLEDLTLYNNRISRVENMDNLTKLQVLSIGNNNLSDLEDLIYLRRFPCLQSVCLRGNPFCDESDYSYFLHAFLPNLVYLDYKRTDANLKKLAYERYQLRIDQLNAQEQSEKEEGLKKEEFLDTEALHQRAFVAGLDSDTVFETLYVNDPDGRELLAVPELQHTIEIFSDGFRTQCKAVFDVALDEHRKRETELKSFQECVDQAKKANKLCGQKMIDEFKEYQAEKFRTLEKMTDPISVEFVVAEYTERLQKLWYELMKNEMVLVEQLDDVIREFELNISEMIDSFLEKVEEHFTECRELQSQFHERLVDTCPMVLERFLRNDSDLVATDALYTIFIDKETVTNALQASNDAHLVQLDNLADGIHRQAKAWLSQLINEIEKNEQHTRNRSRVIEINRVIDAFRDELEQLDLPTLAET